jgi:hypothetical protein
MKKQKRSKARVCSRSLAGIAGSNPAGGTDVCCTVRTKGSKPGQSGQRSSTDEVQRERERERDNPAGGKNVCLLCLLCCVGRGFGDGPKTLPGEPCSCLIM